MSASMVDVLMITYNRDRYTGLSLKRLLDTAPTNARVWVWHNGDHAATLKTVLSLREHPRFFRFHHSHENMKLREPTNWFWDQSDGDFVGKVDDDCLVPEGWIETLAKAHADVPAFGVIGCWPFAKEDYVPELAADKTKAFDSGHQLLQNCWIGGSGYITKRECIDQVGPIAPDQSFTGYCIQLALRGWANGWYLPFLYQDHMDDPRSEHTNFRTDADFRRLHPLTAKNFSVHTLEGWVGFIREDARISQTASTDPRQYVGWRAKLKRARKRLLR